MRLIAFANVRKKIPKPYDTASGLIIFKKSVLTRQMLSSLQNLKQKSYKNDSLSCTIYPPH